MDRQNKLEELASRGRKTQEEGIESEKKEAARKAERDRRQAMVIAKVSMTSLGEYWPKDTSEWITWFIVLLAVPWLFPVPISWKGPIDLVLVIGYLALMLIAYQLGSKYFKQELAWLASLPFLVEGYVESLGDLNGRISAPNVTGLSVGVTFRISFVKPPPEEFKDIFIGFDSVLRLSTDENGDWVLVKPDFLGGASNYPLHVYVHRLVEVVLLSMANSYPMKRLKVRLNTFKNEMEDDHEKMERVMREDRERCKKS